MRLRLEIILFPLKKKFWSGIGSGLKNKGKVYVKRSIFEPPYKRGVNTTFIIFLKEKQTHHTALKDSTVT